MAAGFFTHIIAVVQIPASSDLHMQSGVPFGLLVQPMAEPGLGESGVPLVDFGAAGPLRYVTCPHLHHIVVLCLLDVAKVWALPRVHQPF